MLLKSLTFEDERTGWKLEDLRLDRFNLLVGASGVGKTRILRALRLLQGICQRSALASLERAIRFDLRFEHEARGYTWRLHSAVREGGPEEDEAGAAFPDVVVLEECLLGDEEGPLIKRDPERFLFRNRELPLLDRSTSALKLLDEPTIERLRQGFAEYFLGEQEDTDLSVPGINVESLLKRYPTSESLRGNAGLHPVLKAFVLQERDPTQFERIKQRFIDIFPSVEDVAVHQWEIEVAGGVVRAWLSFDLKERGVPTWIEAGEISSGMARTLSHLVELTVAPAGTVVLIDEFENSLGVNCMGPLTDFILSRANDLQFIITSHHPYIINNIPKAYWKIVRRKGSTVRVTPASEIPALQGPSAQDDFIRLINSPEFEEGME